MRRLLLLIVAIIFILVPGVTLAAGDVTQALTQIYSSDRHLVRRIITFSCTGDSSDGSIPNTDTSATNTALIKGWYLYKVQTDGNHAGTEPTENSDVYIKDASGIDLLDGNGVDMLDNTAEREFHPAIDGTPALQAIDGTITLDVDNQGVNSATYTVKLIFVK